MKMEQPVKVLEANRKLCYHCGQVCDTQNFSISDKSFCCSGCKTVYEILQENDLCEYYSFENNPGLQHKIAPDSFAFLSDPQIESKLIDFEIKGVVRVHFYTPAIHCVSCIWLLENLSRMNSAIIRSEVNFSSRNISIDYRKDEIDLSGVARLLSSVGYPPLITLSDDERVAEKPDPQNLLLRLAIAGFCFGNIMLLSFPEYLGINETDDLLIRIFSGLNLILSLPVVFYSAGLYFQSAFSGLRQKQVNIDVPIVIGILALFGRSIYEVVLNIGPGYLDSLSGLIFFLLIGRWFQNKTYQNLAFDRDYKSYFPLATQRLENGEWKPVVINKLKVGDTIKVRSQEIVPADSRLISDAFIDYSFVTGESSPVQIRKNECVHAGGKIIGQPVELVVEKESSQGHLTQLWNHSVFQKKSNSRFKTLIDQIAKVFTLIVLGVACVAGTYWFIVDSSQWISVITAVLIVACPCALALATPFTYGSMLRVFGKKGLYLKNTEVIEHMATLDALVFDKTGTITYGSSRLEWNGQLNEREKSIIQYLTGFSTHPLSVAISKHLPQQKGIEVRSFFEMPGQGISGEVEGKEYRIGSASFVRLEEFINDTSKRVYVSIDNSPRGYFIVQDSLRNEIEHLIKRLNVKTLALLSGDGNGDRERIASLFPAETKLYFNQSPEDKLNFIEQLQRQGSRVMMIGDGLNDSGALKQSDVGIAITDDSAAFTPASDGIMDGTSLCHLDSFILLSKSAVRILKIAFGISFLYNLVGLSFAVSGHLSPLVAAILMPISSISVVGFSSLAVSLVGYFKMKS